MSPRRIPVDFDQLEWALTDSEGTDSFLDTQSGEVIRISPHLDAEEREALADQIDDAPDDQYVRVDPWGSHVEFDLMVEFADTVSNQELSRLLQVALNGRGAFRRFKDVLQDFPDQRAAWFEFRSANIRRLILEWLADNDLEPDLPDVNS